MLTALALVASVLVAAPVSAADDPPKPSYEATFSACVGDATGDAGFTDVLTVNPAKTAIDCIAYYGITMGTGDGTTYSPVMSVDREQMALFLKRLAEVVAIEMVDDPADPGFTDIGDLSDESQTAIAQMKALDITKGNNASGTTYGPSDPVTRGQMALFIARLMANMVPIDDGDNDKATGWGFVPDNVEQNVKGSDTEVESPFLDLDPVTKETFDAITSLYELGVASGVSGKADEYGPFRQITRQSMAQFMAGVLGHSNARPDGVTIQASTAGDFEDSLDELVVVASVRSAMFAPIANRPVDVFSSEHQRTKGLNNDGTCTTATKADFDCVWDDSDEVTNSQGNLQLDEPAVNPGKSKVFYAWVGTADGDEFDADAEEADHDTVSVTSRKAEQSMTTKLSLPELADVNDTDSFVSAHLGRTSSVMITVQLVDDMSNAVARSGRTINVGVVEAPGAAVGDDSSVASPSTDTSVGKWDTDENGKITFMVNAPKATADNDNRDDTITFTYEETVAGFDADGDGDNDNQVVVRIRWIEADSVATSLVGDAPSYVVPNTSDEVSLTLSAVLYDQYGKGMPGSDDVTFSFASGFTADAGAVLTDNPNRNGKASVRVSGTVAEGTPIDVTIEGYTITGENNQPPADIQVVEEAGSNDAGLVTVDAVLAREDSLLADTADTPDGNSNVLFSYGNDDIFIFSDSSAANGYEVGDELTLDEFEELIGSDIDLTETGAGKAKVDVVVYRPNGESIFKITRKATAA